MIVPSPHGLRKLEDEFAGAGLPTYWSLVINSAEDEADAGPGIDVVFHLGADRELFRLIRKRSDSIRRTVGADLPIRARTILFHLAMSRFGSIVSGRERVLSTNITNIAEPRTRRTAGKVAYLYDVDVVGVGISPAPHVREVVRSEVRQIALGFNQESRYLRINRLQIGFVPARLLPQSYRVAFSPISLGVSRS